LPKFRLIYLAPALALIALLAWALSSPIGSSPDDDFHLASIWCANSSNTAACKPGHTQYERIVPPAVHYAPCFKRKASESAACQAKYVAEGSKPSVNTARGDFDNNYPPVYYATMSILVGPNIVVSVFLMRVLNIVLLIGITTALYLLLPRRRRGTLIWGWVLTTMPLGLFLIASNNPSSWAITGIGSAWLALLGYFETKGKRRIALGALFALTGLMASGSRGDAAVYTGLSVVIVFILTFERTRSYLLRAILPLVMCVVAAYFYLSSQQSTIVSHGLGSTTTGSGGAHVNSASLLVNDFLGIPSLWSGVFGGWALGWLDTAMPTIVTFAGIVAFVGIVFIGLTRLSRRKAIALAIVGATLWLLPTYVLVKGLNTVGQNVQPRYLLPLIILFGGLALLVVDRIPFRITRAHVIIVVTALSVAGSIALYFNMRRYVTGVVGHQINLDSHAGGWWWSIPIPPMAVWGIGSIAYAGLLIVLVRELTRKNAI
jgi:hypothetical protein